MKACILGAALESNNMGVSALAASSINLVLKHYPDAEITSMIGFRSDKPQPVLYKGKKIDIPVVNFRHSPKAPLQKQLIFIFLSSILYRIIPLKSFRNYILSHNLWLKTLAETDFVGDIRGGDSFSDIYGVRRFIFGCSPDLIVLLMKRKLILLPQTYGPYNSAISRKIASYILSKAEKIYSRDLESIPLVKNLLKNEQQEEKIGFCPDVAFTLESKRPDIMEIDPPINGKVEQGGIIGININGLMYNGGYTRSNMFGLSLDYKEFVRAMIESLLLKTEDQILLIPHTFAPSGNVNSDPDASLDIFTKLSKEHPNRIHLVTRKYDQNEIKGIIGLCDFMIGSRMHACIAALSQGIPTVGVAYSKKFQGVFNSVGFGDYVIDVRSENAENALNKVLQLYENRSDHSAVIDEKLHTARERISKSFSEMIKE